MVNLTGLIAVIFVFVGVCVLLTIPTLIEWIARMRFSKRFERLVRQGHVIPIFSRSAAKEKDLPRLRRITTRSLKEAWISGGKGAVDVNIKGWKPITATFTAVHDERPVTSEILTSKAQKKRAKHFLDTLRYKKIENMIQPHSQVDPWPIVEGEEDADKRRAGKVQTATLILMPSKLQHSLQSTEADPSRSEKGAGRWTQPEATLSSVRHPAYPFSLFREDPGPSSIEARGSFGDTVAQKVPLSAMEIGVAEGNLDQASDILELVEKNKEEEDERGSVFTLGNDDEGVGEMVRVLAANTHRYPIYGRPYVMIRPSPLTGGRTRVY